MGVHWLEPMFVEEEQPPFDGRFPKSEPSSSASSCQIWSYGLDASAASGRHAHDTCGHGKPSSINMRKPWGFQEVSRKTWQIMDLGHGRMANCVHGQLWVPSVQERGLPKSAITHTRLLLSAHPSHTPRRAESRAELERGTNGAGRGYYILAGCVSAATEVQPASDQLHPHRTALQNSPHLRTSPLVFPAYSPTRLLAFVA